ncbi:MAG: PilZ domain-containing protein [Xanthobacteraceae bacterium]
MTTSNKRKKARAPSFLGGTITYNRDLWSADCVIKNISDTGAKLTGRNLPMLPDRFYLLIPQKKTKYLVHVRWRARDQIGVEFEQICSDEGQQPAKRLKPIHPEDESIVDAPLITDMAI